MIHNCVATETMHSLHSHILSEEIYNKFKHTSEYQEEEKKYFKVKKYTNNNKN